MRLRKILILFSVFCVVFVNGFAKAPEVTNRILSDDIMKPIKIMAVEKTLMVLDSADQQLKTIDLNGKILQTLGSKGQGPRETINASDFELANGNIYILDASGQKVEIYSQKDGKHVATKKIAAQGLFRMVIENNIFYICGLKFVKGQKIISKLVEKADTKELVVTDSFLECTPMTPDHLASMYKNFGTMTSTDKSIFFAFMVVNKVLEFSKDGKLLKEYLLPIESLDLNSIKNSPNMVLKKGVNYDIRAKNNQIYLLSRDLKLNKTIIFKLKNGNFEKIYEFNEYLMSFDITDENIYGIDAEEFEILIYKR